MRGSLADTRSRIHNASETGRSKAHSRKGQGTLAADLKDGRKERIRQRMQQEVIRWP